MRRLFAIFGVLLTVFLAACQGLPTENTDTIRIVTTIFPPYDFARAVADGRAEISMLLKPGTESHSYEPSPQDILLVESCDLFIYNGGESDVWVDSILETIDTSKLCIIKMMDCVEGLSEEHVEGMQTVHTHHDHHHEEDEFHPEIAEYDEHVWTSPVNAMQITEEIAAKLADLDPAGAEHYQENAKAYQDKLLQLHGTFEKIVADGVRNTVIFGDRFPFRYFAEEYGLNYRAAFPGCSAESEPSAKTVAYLIDKVKEEGIHYIFYIEFSNQRIAKTIQEETGARPLLFHSCHNLSADEMAEDVTYLDLMRQNAENLKEALTDGNHGNESSDPWL